MFGSSRSLRKTGMMSRVLSCNKLIPRLPRLARSHRTHEHPHVKGEFGLRETGNPSDWAQRDWSHRAFTVGIGGPVGSGKTALVLLSLIHI